MLTLIKKLVAAAALVAAIAIPAAALPIGGAAPVAPPTDRMLALLATMLPNTWADAGTFVTTSPTLSGIAWNCAAQPCASAPVGAPSATMIAGTNGPSAKLYAWSSGVLDTTNKVYFVKGGGHTDYCGNELYGFNYSALTWSRLSVPSNITGFNCGGGETRETFPSDGQPISSHDYGALSFSPITGLVYSFRNCGETAGGCGGSQPGSDSFKISIPGLSPTAFGNWSTITQLPSFGVDTMAAYDPTSTKFYIYGGGGGNPLTTYTPGSNTYAAVPGAGATAPDFHMTGEVQPGSQFIVIGGGFFQAVSLSTGNQLTAAASGTTTCVSADSPGLKWDPSNSQFVLWCGGTAIYFINPSTYQITQHTISGSNVVTPQCSPSDGHCTSSTGYSGDGTFGKFQYLPAPYNCFIITNTIFDHTYVYKPDF